MYCQVHYCSVDCQKASRKAHKPACVPAAKPTSTQSEIKTAASGRTFLIPNKPLRPDEQSIASIWITGPESLCIHPDEVCRSCRWCGVECWVIPRDRDNPSICCGRCLCRANPRFEAIWHEQRMNDLFAITFRGESGLFFLPLLCVCAFPSACWSLSSPLSLPLCRAPTRTRPATVSASGSCASVVGVFLRGTIEARDIEADAAITQSRIA